jgi:hypothetical protein
MRNLAAPWIALIAAVSAAGCTTVSVDTMHVSHPLKGTPFGPANEEDTLDVIGVTARKEFGRMYIEHSLQYRYIDGGFYGDDFIYTGRVGVTLWSARK